MNKNSALIWLPKIVAAGLPTPKTEVVTYDHVLIANAIENCKPSNELEYLAVEASMACNKIGYPAFIRTDLSSAKHDGPRAYRVDSAADIARVLHATIVDNEMKFWLEPEPPRAMLVREWIDLDSPFSAFRGHAIAREWRFFADGERVHCFHPYWPEDSIQFFNIQEPDGWRDALKELHAVPDNVDQLKAMAIEAARLYGCYSSVDIAMDANGKWWITDMATAEDSYHWPDCERK